MDTEMKELDKILDEHFEHGAFNPATTGEKFKVYQEQYRKEARNKILGWHAKYINRTRLEAHVDILSELARNCCYTSGAKKVDYVPLFRIQDKLEILEKVLANQLPYEEKE